MVSSLLYRSMPVLQALHDSGYICYGHSFSQWLLDSHNICWPTIHISAVNCPCHMKAGALSMELEIHILCLRRHALDSHPAQRAAHMACCCGVWVLHDGQHRHRPAQLLASASLHQSHLLRSASQLPRPAQGSPIAKRRQMEALQILKAAAGQGHAA